MEIKKDDQFLSLPWEKIPSLSDEKIESNGQHYAQFGRYGLFVINDENFRSGDGSRFYIFSPDTDALNTTEKVIRKLMDEDTKFRDDAVNAGFSRIEDQDLPLANFQLYKCPSLKFQSSNEHLVGIIRELQDLQMLPEGLEKWLPVKKEKVV